MNETVRKRWLGAALMASIAATVWVASRDETDDPGAALRDERDRGRPSKTPISNQADDAPLMLDRLSTRPARAEVRMLFPSQTWAPPPPPPAPASATEEAEKRRPPSLPFTYFGGMIEDGNAVAFLARGNRDYSVKVGDTIDRLYRIEEISERSIVMTYIPLDARQTLSTGGGK